VAEDAQAFLQSSASIPAKHWGTTGGFSLVIYGQRFCSFPKAVALVTHLEKTHRTSSWNTAKYIIPEQRLTNPVKTTPHLISTGFGVATGVPFWKRGLCILRVNLMAYETFSGFVQSARSRDQYLINVSSAYVLHSFPFHSYPSV
jgi:hypothetical protein